MRCLIDSRGMLPSVVLATFLGASLASAVSSEQTARRVEPNISGQSHWAFRPISRPPIPVVKQVSWVRSPIDAFVLAGLESQGLAPNSSATNVELLRRLYLDLIGLPPTVEDQARFLGPSTDTSLDREIDLLLGSPAYGERWGRHWLDLVRYAESNGYERDAEKPHVWRYRDYVIDSLNLDKPFDQFALEQLAGDELPDRNATSLIATGFYRLGPWDDEPADFDQDRHDQLDDIIRTTSQVFLGLTMGCARCHDHKFDELSMVDYYRMSAIFSPLRRPQQGRRELDMFAGSRSQIAMVKERDRRIAERRAQQREILDAFRKPFLDGGEHAFSAEIVRAFAAPAGIRTNKQAALVSKHRLEVDGQVLIHLPAERRRLHERLEQEIRHEREHIPDPPRAYFFVEQGPTPPKSYLLYRGRAATPGDEVRPGLPAALVTQQPNWKPGEETSGRRLALAEWIASRDNPLTPRVIVNRIWQYHFGRGLVATPSDFGVMGDSPTHPQLLDWLANWFIHEGQWSVKALHRLILGSNTYRMNKSWNERNAQVDADNRLLWRFPYRRLEVEVIRDSMLASSGLLNREMYGPGVKLDIPRVVVEGHADRDSIWKPSSDRQQSRRTVYAYVKRSLVVPMLEVLDLCDTTRSTELRNITSVAPQALTLFNGEFVNHQAAQLAERLRREVGSEPQSQIERAWQLTLCRRPSVREKNGMVEFLITETERLLQESSGSLARREAHQRALIQACRVIYNLNEFVYPN